MNTIRKITAIILAVLSVFFAFYFFWLSPRYTVPILMYHRFGYENNTLCVTPENFKHQMAYLNAKRYQVISLDQLVKGIKANKQFKHNTVVLTIDDGYQDNYVYAYPILKKYKFPATIFIIANQISSRNDLMTWDEIRTMADNGISFGGHTKDHVYLPSIKDNQVLWDEIAGCKKLIESKLNKPVDYFCYPTGGFTEEVKNMVKKAGYLGACTTNRGTVKFNKDVYELKRIKIDNHDLEKPLSFWAKLTGCYNLFRKNKANLNWD